MDLRQSAPGHFTGMPGRCLAVGAKPGRERLESIGVSFIHSSTHTQIRTSPNEMNESERIRTNPNEMNESEPITGNGGRSGAG
jgi:hypothetical protein